MSQKIKVAQKAELQVGCGLSVEANGEKVALFYVNDEIYALADRCTHAQGPLSEGDIEDGAVSCPWHGAKFDLKSGQVLSAPAFEGVKSYPVTIEDDDIFIEMDG